MYINQQLSPFSPTSFGTQSMMGLGMQMILLNQMMKLMMTVFALVAGGSGQAAFSGGSPAFGSGGGFNAGGSPLGNFLGSGGAGGAGGAASSAPVGDAKSVGGGFVSPVDNYRISSRFGPRKSPTAGASSNHKGIDLAAPLNTPVRAAKAGPGGLRETSGKPRRTQFRSPEAAQRIKDPHKRIKDPHKTDTAEGWGLRI